jgi:SAM-dependent methyltransferase
LYEGLRCRFEKPVHMTDKKSFFPATGMPDRDWWAELWPNPTSVLEMVGLQAGMSVVDLCCGDGYFTAPLARLVSPGRVIAIDLDPAMLVQAQIACEHCANCTFVRADARELATRIAQPVDCVLIANTFHGVQDPLALARGAHAALRPGGLFIVINWHPLPRENTRVLGQPRGPATAMRMSWQAVVEVVAPAGFEIDRLVELAPYHYGAIFFRKA